MSKALGAVWPCVITSLLALGVCLGLILSFLPKISPVSLISQHDWRIEGLFFQTPLETAGKLDVPKEILNDKNLLLWRSWSPATRSTAGTLRTVPFELPRFLAVPFYGFPKEQPGNRIFLRCLATDANMDVAVSRTNTQWAVAYLRVPAGFCPGKAELLATAKPNFYVGVGTPFAIDAARFYANTTIFPKLVIVVATWLLLCVLIFTLGYCASALFNTDALAAGFILVGVGSMIDFTVFSFSLHGGIFVAFVIVLAGLIGAIAVWRVDRAGSLKIVGRGAPAALVWLAVCVAYAAFISAVDNGGGSWAVNGLFAPLRWSSDNQLPVLFSEAMFDGVPRETIKWGAWFASDRTPLLTTLLLIFRPTIIAPFSFGMGTDFISSAYQLSALTILASWSGALYYFCLRFGRSCAGYVVFLAFVTSFFLFNTVYIWPKLLGATYALVAFGLLVNLGEKPRRGPADLAFVAVAAALSYLAHGSNALVLVPMAIMYLPMILRRGFFEIVVASFAAFVCAAPWLWWQSFVQPGGNALIKFALTGDIYSTAHRGITMMTSIRTAYEHLGLAGWIANKRDGLVTLLGLRTDWTNFPEVARYFPGADILGVSRALDFFLPIRSLGIATFGLYALVMLKLSGMGKRNYVATNAAIVGLASILLSLLVLLPPLITHVLPYGALVLLFLAEALTLNSSWKAVKWGSLVIATVYFLVVWIISPLLVALRIEWTSLVTAALAALVCALLLFDSSTTLERRTNNGLPR